MSRILSLTRFTGGIRRDEGEDMCGRSIMAAPPSYATGGAGRIGWLNCHVGDQFLADEGRVDEQTPPFFKTLDPRSNDKVSGRHCCAARWEMTGSHQPRLPNGPMRGQKVGDDAALKVQTQPSGSGACRLKHKGGFPRWGLRQYQGLLAIFRGLDGNLRSFVFRWRPGLGWRGVLRRCREVCASSLLVSLVSLLRSGALGCSTTQMSP
jgi:hypothetical protein